MEAKELLEKLKNGQASYDDLLNWCIENKEKMNLKEKRIKFIRLKHYNIVLREKLI